MTNVVFVLVDDMALDEYQVLTKTQALLGDSGVTFTNAFDNNPLCCPTRSTLLTGQRSLNHGVLFNAPSDGGGYPALDHSNTFAVWAQDSGIRTALVGKFLNGYGSSSYVPGVVDTLEIPPGWDDWQALLPTLKAYRYKINDNGQIAQYGAKISDHQTDVIARRSLEVIDESVAAGDPFFLWVTPHAPHSENAGPPVPADRYLHAFDGIALPVSPNFDEPDVSDKPSLVRNAPRLSEAKLAYLRTLYENRLESLLAVDDLVASIYDRLAHYDIVNQTLVIFASDNGYLLGGHRLEGKQVVYEESIRIPLVMRGGPFRGGRQVDELVSTVDIVPTLTSLLSIEPGIEPDGLDLSRIVRHPSEYDNRALSIESFDVDTPFTAVRTENWVWVEYINGERELYDLVHDPYELSSRHAVPAYAGQRLALATALAQIRTCAGAACDVRIDLPPK